MTEEVLDGRIVVSVSPDRSGRMRIWLDSRENLAGSMGLMPIDLAALLDGPLERALRAANEERT